MGILGSRLKHAWNAFMNADDQFRVMSEVGQVGASYGMRPDRVRLHFTNERTIISSIYTRLAIDIASISLRHVRNDDQGRYLEDMVSGLNNCLTLEANIDQAARAFRQDIVFTILDEGVAAIVPVDTSINPDESGSYDIKTLRVGKIMEWYPRHVRVELWNEAKGLREPIILSKSVVGIVENPLYWVMNEPNSTLQRLIRKLNLLDVGDDAAVSGKMDIIIQLPYVVKTESRRRQADQRRRDIEFQLKGSQYGIAYVDGTEKVTQLNRPAENNLLEKVQYLTAELYTQLGLTVEVMNGTADEKAMLNYLNRTVEPILAAIAEAMKRTFLTATARTQNQSIEYFKDPFKLVPVTEIAQIADVFSRNEIMTSNEVRQAIGMRPSKDKAADKLQNSNMPQRPSVPQVPGQPPNHLPIVLPARNGVPAANGKQAVNTN
jgi:hypothetical protein